MSLLRLKDLTLQIGRQTLLDKVNLSLERGERVCLLGRNGEGKSTLLRIIEGSQQADDGERVLQGGMRMARLVQDLPDVSGADTVFDVVAQGLGELGAVLAEYHHVLSEASDDLERMGRLQARIDAGDGWTLDARVEAVLSRLSLAGDAHFGDLSGGKQRRVLLAQALVTEPDLLLLDEPTNHLDIDSIAWLEDFLKGWNGALLFITHDRAFLRNLATRIVELDRGLLTSWPGDYDNFLRRKQEALDAEAQANAQFDKKLAQEEQWIRQGIQARRTRNEGRVRALHAMREEFRQRRTRQGVAKVAVQEAERSGKLVIEAEGLNYRWDKTPIVTDFSTTILRGERIGIIGPNGVGKTTLLRLLLGELTPASGQVKLGARLEVAYFDQARATLDPDSPVCEVIGEGQDFVQIGEVRKHVLSYLQDFLFTPERARSPVRVLSGGERARLLLARLFSKPCNVLVLDEPTNDLDLETLDLLEERLLDYTGTLFLVSHDREFLDRVVTRCLSLDGSGQIDDTIGGYHDCLRQRRASPAEVPERKPAKATKPNAPKKAVSALSSAQRKRLRNLPAELEKLEAQQQECAEALAAPDLFQADPDKARSLQQQLQALEADITAAYAEWESLEELAGG